MTKVLPLAIQYGMSVEQFWHEDPNLFKVYEIAYYRNMSYTAWLNGKYEFLAVQMGVSNCLASKKSEQHDFPNYQDPFPEEEYKPTKQDIEINHRNLMAENSNWLKSLLKGEKGAK